MPLTVEVCGKAVSIVLEEADVHKLREWNDRIVVVLELLISADVVRSYKNRIDWFLVFPPYGMEPVELMVELKKRLAAS